MKKRCIFPPEKPENLDKSIWFSYIFPTFSTVLYRNLLCGCSRGCSRGYVRGARVSTPAVNLLNENPTLVALGKLTHTNPRATHEPTNPRTHEPAQPSLAQPSRTARSMGNLCTGSTPAARRQLGGNDISSPAGLGIHPLQEPAGGACQGAAGSTVLIENLFRGCSAVLGGAQSGSTSRPRPLTY